jgi:VCBS repeat-containing protein
VRSGGVNTTQSLTITITGVNDEPAITSGPATPVYNDTDTDDSFANTTGSVTYGDDDGDSITFGVAFGDDLGTADDTLPGYDTAVTGQYGTLYVNSSSGAYEYVPDDAAVEALKTTANDVFSLTIDDGNGGSDSQLFDVTLNGVNDRPEVALIPGLVIDDTVADDTYAPVSGTLAGSDRDNDTLTYRATGDVVDHSESGYNRSVAGDYGTLYLKTGTGEYKYIADNTAVEGLKTTQFDTFTMRANDGTVSSLLQPLAITLNGVNDTPDMIGSTGGNLVEAGGVANGTPGTDTSFLTVSLSDRDDGDTAEFDVDALEADGWTVVVSRPPLFGLDPTHYSKEGNYGTATLNIVTGQVDYELDNDDADTQGLNVGDQVEDNFTVFGTDGTAGASVGIVFTIDGANDNAVIGGTLSGDATEAGGVGNGTPGSPASGTATSADVDNNDDAFMPVGFGTSISGYGNYSVDASGLWTYSIDEDDVTVQALNDGDSLSDSFVIFSEDFTIQTINIIIHGVNDSAVVAGDTTGAVTESGGALSPGDPDVSGTLSSEDVDNADNSFTAVGPGADTDNGYGKYSVDAAGNWEFDLKNGNKTIQALNDGDVLIDTFTVLTEDGTAQVVTITIDGQNEQFEGTNGDNVIEGTKWGDTMTGFDGNDLYLANNAADVVVEAANEGEDQIRAKISYTLSDNVENMTLLGSADIDGTGNTLGNVIVGNGGRNVLSGLDGDDNLKGGAGGDVLEGGENDDILNGGDGDDTASYEGAAAGVTVSLATTSFQNTGGAGFDKLLSIEDLEGSGFDDTLTGSAGKNVIDGCGGQDVMTGGAGNDRFVFDTGDTTNATPDTITDIENTDKIDLSAIGSFTVVGSFSGSAGELVLTYDSLNDVTVVAGDVDGDTTADLTILLTGDHTDFDNFI